MFVLICTKFRIIQLKKKNPGLDTQLNPFDNKPFKNKGFFPHLLDVTDKMAVELDPVAT